MCDFIAFTLLQPLALDLWPKSPFLFLSTNPPSLLLPLQCSVSCGRGTKQREIACVYQNQTKIDEDHCSHLPRPRTQKACRAQGCPSWKANRWREVCLLFALSPLARIITLWETVLSVTAARSRDASTNTVERFPEAADVGHVHTQHLSNHRSVYSYSRVMCHFPRGKLNIAGWICKSVYVAHITFIFQL